MSNCIDTISAEQTFVAPSLTWHNWLRAGKDLLVQDLVKLTDKIGEWSERDRARRHLMTSVDKRMLDDLAWSPATIIDEAVKPFWRE